MKFFKLSVYGFIAFVFFVAISVIVSATIETPLQKAENMFSETSLSLVYAKEHEEKSYDAYEKAKEYYNHSKRLTESAQQINNYYRCAIANMKLADGIEITDPETSEICKLGK